ncbi:MAG: 4Fe-4S dicluster domain-containing protein [Candidatus Fermentibacter sp.]|nr:4Fe-4S dicluster domain-containing protein [Candidatus Fermentibacter sp.]
MTDMVQGRESLVRLLEGILAMPGVTVYAPVAEGDGAAFGRIGSASEALLDCSGVVRPPRQILAPMTEILLTVEPDGSTVDRVPAPEPMILFGARPCDSRAIAFLDRVYAGGDRIDPYYAARREALTIVSIGCREPRATCFCTSTGGGPLSREGSDILLEPSGEGWIVRVITDKGASLAGRAGLESPDERVPDPAVSPMAGEPRDLAVLRERLEKAFDDPRWEALTAKCLGCGACTFICPSCHCFDIVDGEEDGRIVRSRIWDSCQFKTFTRQASGHDPRPTGAERYRHRLMHKFSYCIESYGMPGCTGCGRCVEACPVNLDIRLLLDAFGGGK